MILVWNGSTCLFVMKGEMELQHLFRYYSTVGNVQRVPYAPGIISRSYCRNLFRFPNMTPDLGLD